MHTRLHPYTQPVIAHARLVGAAACTAAVTFIAVEPDIAWLDAFIFPIALLGAWLLVGETVQQVKRAIERSRRHLPVGVPVPSSMCDGFGAMVTERLSTVATVDELIDLVPKLAVAGCADWVTLYQPQGDHLVRVASMHVDPTWDAEVRQFIGTHPVPLDSENDISRVFRRHIPMVSPHLTDAALDQMAVDDDYAAKLRPVKIRAAVGWPINVGPDCYGVIAFMRTGDAGRQFTDDDIGRISAFMARVATTFAAVVQRGYAGV